MWEYDVRTKSLGQNGIFKGRGNGETPPPPGKYTIGKFFDDPKEGLSAYLIPLTGNETGRIHQGDSISLSHVLRAEIALSGDTKLEVM